MANNIKDWIEAKKKYHLSDMHIQMARELGNLPFCLPISDECFPRRSIEILLIGNRRVTFMKSHSLAAPISS